MREFINYDSQIFKTTVDLMKKYNLASFEYQDWVDVSEYDEDLYDHVALDTCIRIYIFHKYHENNEEIIETIKEIFYYFHGCNARDDTELIGKIKLLTKDLLKEYKRFEELQDEINRDKIMEMYSNDFDCY